MLIDDLLGNLHSLKLLDHVRDHFGTRIGISLNEFELGPESTNDLLWLKSICFVDGKESVCHGGITEWRSTAGPARARLKTTSKYAAGPVRCIAGLCLPIPAGERSEENAAGLQERRNLGLNGKLPHQLGILSLKIAGPTRRIELMHLAANEVLEDVPSGLQFRRRAFDCREVIWRGHEAFDERTEEVRRHLR